MLMSDFMDLARQVCTGLDHAHHHGLFHTNLHPGNIVVELDGTAKILDFGIPKDIPPDDDRLRYAAPEQLRGNPPDARVNLFSWGAILYELLTRRPAFAGCDREALPPAPHAVDAAIPEGISRALMKALALDPAERYASGQDLVAALEDRVAQRPLPVPVPCTEPPVPKRAAQPAAAYAAMVPLSPEALSSTEPHWTSAPPTPPAPPDLVIADDDEKPATVYAPPPP